MHPGFSCDMAVLISRLKTPETDLIGPLGWSGLWTSCSVCMSAGLPHEHPRMPFLNGTVTYARFAVTGDAPTRIDQTVIDAFAANPARPTPVGVPPGPEAGWTAGHHILDENFSIERMAFEGWVHAGMRLDVVRVPPEVRRAYVAIAEQARSAAMEEGAPGWLSRTARREARAEAQRQWEEEVGQGRYRSSKLVPFLWNPAKRIVLTPATSDAVLAPMRDLFTATFGGRLEPRSSGSLALDMIASQGLLSSFEDARPDSIGRAPAGGQEGHPEVPWASGGPEPKDFLGNVFLLWLWWRFETGEGLIDPPNGRPIGITIDRSLESECAWGLNGRQTLTGEGPTSWAESRIAVANGKWPRRIGLLVSDGEYDWACTLQGDRFTVSGLRLPRAEAPAATPAEAALQRIDSIASFDQALLGLYQTFITERFAPNWPTVRGQIGDWLNARTREAVAVEPKVRSETATEV